MAEEKQKPKKYKETLEKLLFTQDYETESNGKTYPTNRIKVELVNYEGEIEKQDGTFQAYGGLKVVITNSKLKEQDGQNVIKQKVIKTKFGDDTTNDETKVKMGVDEFDAIINHFKDLKLSQEKKN